MSSEKPKKFRLMPNEQPSTLAPDLSTERSERSGSVVATGFGNMDLPTLFAGADLKRTTAEQFLASVEGGTCTQLSVRRALSFKPYDGDVLVACAARSGEGIVMCLLQMLSVGAGDIDARGNRMAESVYEVPLIEHRRYDENPRVLDELQAGVFRLYQTQMNFKSLPTQSPGKFITVLREPKDFYLAWFNYLEKLYERERQADGSGGAAATPFSARFSPDDFAKLNPWFSHGYNGDTTYFDNMLDWVRAKDLPNVHIVFYEDIIDDTPQVLDELAAFLEVEVSSEARSRMLNHTTYQKMREQYPRFHQFNVADAEVRPGQGMRAMSAHTNTHLNQQWNFIIRSPAPHLKDYATMYTKVTGREFPFAFTTIKPDERGDLLMEDLQSCLSGFCFPSRRRLNQSDSRSGSIFQANRFSKWL